MAGIEKHAGFCPTVLPSQVLMAEMATTDVPVSPVAPDAAPEVQKKQVFPIFVAAPWFLPGGQYRLFLCGVPGEPLSKELYCDGYSL